MSPKVSNSRRNAPIAALAVAGVERNVPAATAAASTKPAILFPNPNFICPPMYCENLRNGILPCRIPHLRRVASAASFHSAAVWSHPRDFFSQYECIVKKSPWGKPSGTHSFSYICVFLLLQTFSYALRWVSRSVLFCGSPAGYLPLRNFSWNDAERYLKSHSL